MQNSSSLHYTTSELYISVRYAYHTFVILDLCLPRVGLKDSAAGDAREKPGCSTTSTPMRTFSGLMIAQHYHSVG